MNRSLLPSTDDPHVDDRISVELRDDPCAPSQARVVVRELLVSWRLPGLVDSVALAVSELVTNALRHGRPPVRLVVQRAPAAVHLDVHDAADTPLPEDHEHVSDDAESGRGLEIVHALAADVACRCVPGCGKVVRASFPTTP